MGKLVDGKWLDGQQLLALLWVAMLLASAIISIIVGGHVVSHVVKESFL